MRVLVIDDYRPHGESLAELLESYGHEAFFAQSYEDARWILDLLEFDVAFLDFDMPEVTGARIAAALAERFPALRSAIVSARPAVAEDPELAHLRVIKKPVEPQEILSFIHTVLRERTGSSVVVRSAFPMVRYR